MSLREALITKKFWAQELVEQGTLYMEYPAVEKKQKVGSPRWIDGLAVCGDSSRIDETGVAQCLDDQDIVIIQTKATRLNPYVFGQALLSQDLIRMRWCPRSIWSVLLCTEDDPELRTVTNEFPDVEIHIRRGERDSFGLTRLPADEVRRAGEQSRRFPGTRSSDQALCYRGRSCSGP